MKNPLEHGTLGIVIDPNDPERLGRCKIRAYKVYDDLPDEELPWAFYGGSAQFAGGESKGYGNISVPKKDSIVRVWFENEDMHYPIWDTIMHINDQLKESLKETYLNSHSILWDEDEGLRAFYTPSNGMQFFLRGSSITINPDESILIDHRDTLSNIELKEGKITVNANSKVEVNTPHAHINGSKTELGTSPVYSFVCGEPMVAHLFELASIIDAKWPSSPGVATSIIQRLARASLSKTVKGTK